MADGDFTKGCLAAILTIAIVVCAVALVFLMIPWRGW